MVSFQGYVPLDGGFSHADGWAMHPPFSFRSCRKENGPCTVQKKRTLRRVGLRQRRPPAAGGRRLAVPRGGQRRKRAALRETFGPGRYRDTSCVSPRCRSRFREEQPAAAKRVAEAIRQPPQRRRHHPPRDGSCKLAEDLSVLEGQAKSEQAPIRRPPCARRATAPECAQRFFLFHRARRILFLGKTKKRMGGASPAGAEPLSIPAPFHRSHKTTSAALSFCGRHRCHFHRSPWTIPLPDLRCRQRLPCAGIRCPGP